MTRPSTPRNRAGWPLPLLALALLASCGPGVTPPVDGGNGGVITSAYIPAKDAAVGTGPDAQATLRVALGFGDVDLMNALNEFRTTGKIGGVDVTAQTCLAGKFTPRGALRFNGAMHHAAYKHLNYLKAVVTNGHVEEQTSHPDFWGAMPWDRVNRSAALFGVQAKYTGEGVGGVSRTGQDAAMAYLRSTEGHCEMLVDPAITQIGASMIGDPTIPYPTQQEREQMTREELGRRLMSISVHVVVVGK